MKWTSFLILQLSIVITFSIAHDFNRGRRESKIQFNGMLSCISFQFSFLEITNKKVKIRNKEVDFLPHFTPSIFTIFSIAHGFNRGWM